MYRTSTHRRAHRVLQAVVGGQRAPAAYDYSADYQVIVIANPLVIPGRPVAWSIRTAPAICSYRRWPRAGAPWTSRPELDAHA